MGPRTIKGTERSAYSEIAAKQMRTNLLRKSDCRPGKKKDEGGDEISTANSNNVENSNNSTSKTINNLEPRFFPLILFVLTKRICFEDNHAFITNYARMKICKCSTLHERAVLLNTFTAVRTLFGNGVL